MCRPGVGAQVALGQVALVLSRDWGYSQQDIRDFDFAALLKIPTGSGSTAGSAAACAALLDVYGEDVAELFVISTHPSYRGRGYARVRVRPLPGRPL